MGLRFRKSKNFGGFRINLSKSGIGYSYGVRGLRLTRKAKGGIRGTASIPGTGISYVKETRKKNKRKGELGYTNRSESVNTHSETEVKSELVVSTQNEFVDKLNKAAKISKSLGWIKKGVPIFLIILGVLLTSFLHRSLIWPFLLAGLVCYLIVPKKIAIKAEFVFENGDIEIAYNNVLEALNRLSHAEKIWEIVAYKEHKNQTEVTHQKITIKKTKYINSETKVLSLNVQKKEVLFLPNIVAVLDGGKWFAVNWENVKVDFRISNVKDEKPARESVIVRKTYMYTTKSGEPDKRYKNNKIVYECECGAVELQSDNGLYTVFVVSNKEAAENFVEKVRKMNAIGHE